MNNCENIQAEGGEELQPTAVGDKKRLKIFGAEIAYLYLIGIIMAMLGWIAENTVKAINEGVIDSRYHTLPFISPYALVPFAMHICFGNADDIAFFGKKLFKQQTLKTKIASNILVFAITCSAVFLGELAVGNLWDAAFGVQLWNYSKLPLQVTQYAGLIPSLGYGAGAYLFFKFVQGPLLKLFRKRCPYKAALVIDCTLGVLIVLDTLAMVVNIMLFNEAPLLWKIKLR